MLVGEVRWATTPRGSSWKLSGGSQLSVAVTKVSKKRQVLRAQQARSRRRPSDSSCASGSRLQPRGGRATPIDARREQPQRAAAAAASGRACRRRRPPPPPAPAPSSQALVPQRRRRARSPPRRRSTRSLAHRGPLAACCRRETSSRYSVRSDAVDRHQGLIEQDAPWPSTLCSDVLAASAAQLAELRRRRLAVAAQGDRRTCRTTIGATIIASANSTSDPRGAARRRAHQLATSSAHQRRRAPSCAAGCRAASSSRTRAGR